MSDLAAFAKNLDQTYSRLNSGLASKVRDYDWRRGQLLALRRMIEENSTQLNEAMWKDLRKSRYECEATEQGVVLSEINDALKNLKKWMKPERAKTPLYNFPGSCEIVREPFGLTLVIGAWNYPVNLTLAPLVGAIAGGNACIIKPSEISAATGHALADLIPRYLDPDLFGVIEGGADETGLLLDKKFDLIFFTGSGPVGKIVLAKAAPHLTPVVLELGGKSPAIILPDADLKVTARRIAWGKFMNAGQTCIAPDYLIVHPQIKDQLVVEIEKSLSEFFGPDIKASGDYCRIVNEKNFDRLAKLLDGQKILFGGATDRSDRFIAPTLIDATAQSPAMQDEIFGPILPLITLSEIPEMISFITSRPKPLALYLFTKDEAAKATFTKRTTSGGMVINDTVIHMPVASLPFGGVGASGMGHYHGRYSFETFTHAKGVLRKAFALDVPVRYAPYSEAKAKVLRWLFS